MSLDYRDVLGEGGLISRKMPNYESRAEQMELAGAVDAAIRSGRHLVAEAGTGVGKSFAYLVPAILHAVEDQNEPELLAPESGGPAPRRVVISTHTIALQEQLFDKDIPFLNSILPYEFSSVLVKGRSNYLCLRRLHAAESRSNSLLSTDEEIEELKRIAEWSRSTDDGSLSDLNPQPAGPIWDEVSCEQGNCMGRQCKHYKQCFYQAARRRVERASIIVVNHALLFSDLAVRSAGGSILPQYDVLVFDEAHTMEQTAGDHLGISVSQGQITYLLNRLWNARTQKGLLALSAKKLAVSGGLTVSAPLFKEAVSKARSLVEESVIRAEETFDDLKEWLYARPGSNGRVTEPGIIRRNLEESLTLLAGALYGVISVLSGAEQKMELTSARQRVLSLKGELTAWINQEDSEMVYWLEKIQRRRGETVRMLAAPVNVGMLLRESLFSKVKTVVMTSATLAAPTNRSLRAGTPPAPFDYFLSRIGLTGALTLLVGSPFRYQENVTLIVPKNMPSPREGNDASNAVFYDALLKYIQETDGGAFVLFTSYSLLTRTADALVGRLARLDYPLITQGKGMSRSQMVENFKTDIHSVLFGTDSFWQGVDVPGSALRNVIITQLPFSVPTHPLTQARCEAIQLAGGNSFYEYSVPEAVIKLKQGFGRLVRTAADRGIVVIMDSRVLSKSYGKTFLRALPDCRFRQD